MLRKRKQLISPNLNPGKNAIARVKEIRLFRLAERHANMARTPRARPTAKRDKESRVGSSGDSLDRCWVGTSCEGGATSATCPPTRPLKDERTNEREGAARQEEGRLLRKVRDWNEDVVRTRAKKESEKGEDGSVKLAGYREGEGETKRDV